MTAVRFMLLMPWGRVGSNLLFHILEQSVRMKADNEGLIHLRTAPEQAAWLFDFYEIGNDAPSRQFIGSKQNIRSICNAEEFADLLLNHSIKVVRLRRDNHVKAAVSQIRAERYAEQTLRETGVARWAVRLGETAPGAMTIDPEVLLKRIVTMETQHRRLMGAFSADSVLDVEYEEIANTLLAVAVRVRTYLNMPQKPFVPKFDKSTPNDLKLAILNFTEIKERVAATAYAGMLS